MQNGFDTIPKLWDSWEEEMWLSDEEEDMRCKIQTIIVSNNEAYKLERPWFVPKLWDNWSDVEDEDKAKEDSNTRADTYKDEAKVQENTQGDNSTYETNNSSQKEIGDTPEINTSEANAPLAIQINTKGKDEMKYDQSDKELCDDRLGMFLKQAKKRKKLKKSKHKSTKKSNYKKNHNAYVPNEEDSNILHKTASEENEHSPVFKDTTYSYEESICLQENVVTDELCLYNSSSNLVNMENFKTSQKKRNVKDPTIGLKIPDPASKSIYFDEICNNGDTTHESVSDKTIDNDEISRLTSEYQSQRHITGHEPIIVNSPKPSKTSNSNKLWRDRLKGKLFPLTMMDVNKLITGVYHYSKTLQDILVQNDPKIGHRAHKN